MKATSELTEEQIQAIQVRTFLSVQNRIEKMIRQQTPDLLRRLVQRFGSLTTVARKVDVSPAHLSLVRSKRKAFGRFKGKTLSPELFLKLAELEGK